MPHSEDEKSDDMLCIVVLIFAVYISINHSLMEWALIIQLLNSQICHSEINILM